MLNFDASSIFSVSICCFSMVYILYIWIYSGFGLCFAKHLSPFTDISVYNAINQFFFFFFFLKSTD